MQKHSIGQTPFSRFADLRNYENDLYNTLKIGQIKQLDCAVLTP